MVHALGPSTRKRAYCVYGTAMNKTSMAKMDRDYQAEDDHRTMLRASEIQADRGRMRGVRNHHRKQTKSLKMMDRSLTGRR